MPDVVKLAVRRLMSTTVLNAVFKANLKTYLVSRTASTAPSATLTKRANGIPLNTIEYHSVSFSTIGPFNVLV